MPASAPAMSSAKVEGSDIAALALVGVPLQLLLRLGQNLAVLCLKEPERGGLDVLDRRFLLRFGELRRGLLERAVDVGLSLRARELRADQRRFFRRKSPRFEGVGVSAFGPAACGEAALGGALGFGSGGLTESVVVISTSGSGGLGNDAGTFGLSPSEDSQGITCDSSGNIGPSLGRGPERHSTRLRRA